MMKTLDKVIGAAEMGGLLTVAAFFHATTPPADTAAKTESSLTSPATGVVDLNSLTLPSINSAAPKLNLMSQSEWNCLSLDEKLESLDRRPTRVR